MNYLILLSLLILNSIYGEKECWNWNGEMACSGNQVDNPEVKIIFKKRVGKIEDFKHLLKEIIIFYNRTFILS
jgi:hypothetical protein